MINQRLKKKYGYSIEQTSIAKLLHQIHLQGDNGQLELIVDKVDLQDVLFVLRTRTDFYAKEVFERGIDIMVNCFRLHDGVRFELIKDVNSENHPYVISTIPKGTILHYSEQPTYGVVNRYKGLPLTGNGHFYQINYNFFELIDSEIRQ